MWYTTKTKALKNRIAKLLPLLLVFAATNVNPTNLQAQKADKGTSFGLPDYGMKIQIPTRADYQSRNSCANHSPYRSIDGTCNNVTAPDGELWGAADIPLYRDIAPQYGQPDPFNDLAGQNRKSPREVSNLLASQSESIPNRLGLSSFVFTWGQFLDHDITLTPEGMESAPIPLPANEPLFTQPIEFHRSEIAPGTGESNARQQRNMITAWIDASNVYGSDLHRATWLRTHQSGKLKTSAGDMLPYNTIDAQKGSAIDPNAPSMGGDDDGTSEIFVAGDVRACEQPGLTALHTLFVREHNRICDEYLANGLTDDELIYQMARKQVGAIIQSITYNEFLPSLGIHLGNYEGYNANLQPDIGNIFATAGYRLGHTMVTEELMLINDDCSMAGAGVMTLLEGFFNINHLEEYGVEPFLKGLATQTQEEVDPMIIDNLRNFLFFNPANGGFNGLDLASLNIQRGRDHGLPDYNTIRQHYLGHRAINWNQITNDQSRKALLQEAYNSNINDIDPWVGLLSEDPLQNCAVGPTLMRVIRTQFRYLRDADYYFYENDPALTAQMRQEIEGSLLSEVIKRNSNVTTLQDNVFQVSDCELMANNGKPWDNGQGSGNGQNNGNGWGMNNGNGWGQGNGNGHGWGNSLGGPGGGKTIAEMAESTLAQNQVFFELSPNPTTSQFIVHFADPAPEPFILRIYSMDGAMHFESEFEDEQGMLQSLVDVSDFLPGMYNVCIQKKYDFLTRKIVIQ